MNIGDLFGGGRVFHVFEDGETGLVAALYDQTDGYKWGGFVDGDFINTFATDTGIGTGQGNTDQIVSILGVNPSAAKLCDDLNLNGFNDWYLPSKDELTALYNQRGLFNNFSLERPYWSSSEYLYSGDYYEKINVRFWNGVAVGAASENLYRVRAIRTASASDPINPIKPAPPILVIPSNYNQSNILPVGITSLMEFSLDGSEYAPYNSEVLNPTLLSGDHTLRVRYPAEGINPASDFVQVLYTVANDQEEEPGEISESLTSADVINILYQHIKNSVLFSDSRKPNGGLYKLQRPSNSVKEDVVINSLPLTREAVQECVLYVNIFVPNMTGDVNLPDLARITELSKLYNSIFQGEVWGQPGTYSFEIDQDFIVQDTGNQHYISFRTEFYSLNT